jgi:hypothetical protein
MEFFNFGPIFIKNILTLCTGRRASVILDDGSLGTFFDLERGNAQGDTISPYLFNIGYQILLLKINFDLQIQGFLDIPERFVSNPEGGEQHPGPKLPPAVSRKTRKVFAFADDCNALIMLTRGNLDLLKKILSDFEKISGLECNIEKSFLMPIGDTSSAITESAGTGFMLTDNLTVLGMNIQNAIDNRYENEKKIGEKVTREINFWKRFNLSLPGRINIAKTMLYSQLNYLGSFLNFNQAFMKEVQQKIYNFVRGNLRIGFDRAFTKVSKGGLGLFHVETFLMAQKVSWFKRALSLDELWKM